MVFSASGRTRFSTKGIHEIFYEYWHSMFLNSEQECLPNDFDLKSEIDLPCNELCDAPISIKEIEDSLKSLKKGKASGLDDIATLFLKDNSKVLISALHILFNRIFDSEYFPIPWKTDRRVPIFKKGSRLDVSMYRLIAVHSIFRKLFCSIIDKRIRSFIHLDDAQNGFRPGRKCTDHIFVLRDLIRLHHRKKKKFFVAVLDFSKAFDRCHIPTLLKKLSQKGVRGKILSLVSICIKTLLHNSISTTHWEESLK